MSTPPDPCKCCKPRYIKFRLNAALSTADEFKAATVEKYWDGIKPDDAATPWVLNVYNLRQTPDGAGGSPVYVYSGVSGDVGYAIWDDVRDLYWIVAPPRATNYGSVCAGLCAYTQIISSSVNYTNQGSTTDYNIYFQAGHADAGFYEIVTTDYGGTVGVKNSGIRILRAGYHLVGAHIGVSPSSPGVTPPSPFDCTAFRRIQADFGVVQDTGATIDDWIGCLGWRFQMLTVCEKRYGQHGGVAMPVLLNVGDILRLRYFRAANDPPSSTYPITVDGDLTGLWVKWQHDDA